MFKNVVINRTLLWIEKFAPIVDGAVCPINERSVREKVRQIGKVFADIELLSFTNVESFSLVGHL